MNTSTTSFWAGLALVSLLAGCAAPGGQPVSETMVPLRFAAEINGQPFECGRSYSGIGVTGSTITPTDWRMYVSNVRLVDANGRETAARLEQDGQWQHGDVALLDFENGSGPCRNGTAGMRDVVRVIAPAGQYRGVRFTLGVPFELNHADPTVAPAPLNLTAMFWNWQGGYKFVKFDTATTGLARAAEAPAAHGAAQASGFSVHLGSTVCAAASPVQKPSACQNPNRVEVVLPVFDPARQVIVADMGRVLGGANVDVNAPRSAPGCMSFPGDADCPPVMAAFGLPYGAGQAASAQVFLRAR